MSNPIHYKVKWSFNASEDLVNIYDYIEQNSPKNADKVIDTLLDLGDSLSFSPLRFPKEPLLEKAPLEFRFIPKWNYKIIYTTDEEKQTVTIARIFNTRQHPSKLKL